jgi:hypothetical protein
MLRSRDNIKVLLSPEVAQEDEQHLLSLLRRLRQTENWLLEASSRRFLIVRSLVILMGQIAKQDGGLTLWSVGDSYFKPTMVSRRESGWVICSELTVICFKSIDNAHISGSETSRIAMSRDNFTLATRGGDDTVKRMDGRCVASYTLRLFFNFVSSI